MSSQSNRKYGRGTTAIHGGSHNDPLTGAITTPIYQTSTFAFPSAEEGARRFAGESDGYIYTRLGNPTVHVLEDKIAMLEGAEAGLAFASGMSAITTVLLGLLKSGDHVLASKGLYGSTYSFLVTLKTSFGIDFTLSDLEDEAAILRDIRSNTRLIFVETPINPTMRLIDLTMLANTAKAHGIYTVVDNTFMSPYLQRPIELGCDIVIHSATKYIGGHGDVVAGLAVGSKEMMHQLFAKTHKHTGSILAPFDAYLLIRGLKTLGVRMDRHCENAQKVAEFLAAHPKVTDVYYPGLPSFPQYELAKRQMDGFGGLMSFELEGGLQAGRKMMDSVELCKLAVSLGDVDSLIQHPASMTHAGIPAAEREQMGITDGLVRLSVGIEDIDDILADLEQALDRA